MITLDLQISRISESRKDGLYHTTLFFSRGSEAQVVSISIRPLSPGRPEEDGWLTMASPLTMSYSGTRRHRLGETVTINIEFTPGVGGDSKKGNQ